MCSWVIFSETARTYIVGIKIAKERGACYRLGPELEVTWVRINSCSFCECCFVQRLWLQWSFPWERHIDTLLGSFGRATEISRHYWHPLWHWHVCTCCCALTPSHSHTLHRPIMHKNVRYNCRVIFYNSEILLIRPKMDLALEGNYREMRWFCPWRKTRLVQYLSVNPYHSVDYSSIGC